MCRCCGGPVIVDDARVRNPSENPLISLGYEGRDAAELIDQLRASGVNALVDVRLTPLSRKPGLSKKRLAAALGEAGIAYVHLPQLGNPKENRAPFRAGEAGSHEEYRRILHTSNGRSALAHVAELLDEGAVALLCFERDHTTCHRHLVVSELQRETPELQVIQL